MKKFNLLFLTLLILLSALCLFSCKNLFNSKNSGKIEFGLGSEVSEKISRTLLQGRGITSSTNLKVQCEILGEDPRKEIKTSSLADLDKVSFHFEELPVEKEYKVVITIEYNDILLYVGASDKFIIEKDSPNHKLNIQMGRNMCQIKYEMNGGAFTHSISQDKIPTEYFIDTPVNIFPKPEKPNDTFSGWYTNKNFEGTPVTSLGPDNFLGDITLYAKWEKSDPTNFIMIRDGVQDTNSVHKEAAQFTADNNSALDTNPVWACFLESVQTFNMEANKNYQISLEMKADSPSFCLLKFKDPQLSDFGSARAVNLTNQWQTITYDTGCWDKAYQGKLQIPFGRTSKIYIKNLKVTEKTDTKLPVDIWVVSENHNNFDYTHIPNGVEFTFKEDNSFGKIGGFQVIGGKLYKVTCKLKADKPVTNVMCYLQTIDDAYEIGLLNTDLDTTAKTIALYAPANTPDYRFGQFEIQAPANTIVTVTDFKVEEVIAPIPEKNFVIFKEGVFDSGNPGPNPQDATLSTFLDPGKEFPVRAMLLDSSLTSMNWNEYTEFRNVISDSPDIEIYKSPSGDYKIIKNKTTSSLYITIEFNNRYDIVVTVQ